MIIASCCAIQVNYFTVNRYRSVYTLPSHSLQPSSPIAEDSKQRTFSCQSSITDSPDVSFARGDCLKQENNDRKSEEENLTSNSSEMPKILENLLVLQMDSMTLAATSEEEKSAKIVEEAIGASNSPSPRRKLSVYCRSFDVVTVQDLCEDRQGSNVEVRRSPSDSSDSSAQVDERLVPEIVARDQNSTSKYPFGCNYRNTKNDSESSNDSTPLKQFRDNLLEDESPIEQPVLRRICLAPTRLRLSQKINELNETVCVPVDFIEPSISSSFPSSVVDNGCKEDDDVLHSSATFIVDKRETEAQDGLRESKSCSENFPREHSTSARRLFPYNRAGKFFDLALDG